MWKACVTLFTILFVVVIFGLMAGLTLRHFGEKQKYEALDHPLLSGPTWTIAYGGDLDQGRPFSKQAFEAAAALSPDIILGAPVQVLRDHTLVIYPTHYVATDKGMQYTERMTPDEFKMLVPDAPTFVEFLEIAKGHVIYLNLNRIQTHHVPIIVKAVAEKFGDKRVLIATSSQPVKKSFKDKEPMWLYGPTAAESGKLRLLGALYLAPTLTLDADFFNADSLPEHVRQELRRRHIRLIFSERKTPDQNVLATQPGQLRGLVDQMGKTH